MAGQQRTSSHPTPWASTVDIAKQNVSRPPPSNAKGPSIMLTGVGRDARTLLYRRHTYCSSQTPAAASRSLQDASLKPKEEGCVSTSVVQRAPAAATLRGTPVGSIAAPPSAAPRAHRRCSHDSSDTTTVDTVTLV